MGKLHDNRSLLLHGSYLFAARAASRALRILYLLVLARAFGPALFGTLSFAHFWTLLLLPLAGWGTNRLLLQRIGKQPERTREHLQQTLGIRLFGIALASLLGFIGITLWPLDPDTRLLLVIFTIAISVRSLAVWAQHSFLAEHQGQVVLRLELVYRTLEVIAGLIAVTLGAELFWIAVIHLLSWTAQSVNSWRLISQRHGQLRPRWLAIESKQLLATGISVMLVGVSIATIENSSLLVMRAQGHSNESLGQLALVLQILMVALMAPKSFAVMALAVLSGQQKKTKPDNNTLSWLLRAALVGGTGLTLIATVVAPLLLPALLGNAYLPASAAAGPALWLLLPIATGVMLNQQITALSRFREAAVMAILGAGVTIGVLLLLPNDTETINKAVTAIALGTGTWSLLQLTFLWKTQALNPLPILVRPGLSIACSLLLFNTLAALPWLALAASLLPLPFGLEGPAQLKGVIYRIVRKRDNTSA